MKRNIYITGCGMMNNFHSTEDISSIDEENIDEENIKKEYVKPETKIIDIKEDEEVMHSSNWYARQNHGHQHKNHDDQDDNGNHYGWDNPNNDLDD